jgi:hypothetical protein
MEDDLVVEYDVDDMDYATMEDDTDYINPSP